MRLINCQSFKKRIQENDDASFSLRFVKYFLKCKSQYIQEPVVIDQNVSPIIISILNKHLKEIKNEIQEEIDKRNMEIEEL